MSVKCSLCRCELKEDVKDFDLPGLRFNWLDGKPFICEKCTARTFGIDSSWSEEIETKLKEKTI